jgi:hypothetical protein
MKLATQFSVVLVSCICWLSASESNAQTIAWKFKADDSYSVQLAQESLVTTEYNLIKRRIGTQVELSMDWTVTAVATDGTATIQQTISDISMTMTTPTQDGVRTIEVDSSKTPDSDAPKVERDMWKQVQPLIGASFDVDMQSNGQINSVTTSDATMETIRNANGSMQLRKLLTPEGLTQLFGQTIVQVPPDTSEPWKVTRTPQTDAGSFESVQTLTVEGETEIESKTLTRITSTTETTQTNTDGENELIEASGTGELLFDSDAGHFVSSNFDNNFTFKRPYRDSAINTVTTSNVTMKIEKKK